MHAEVVAINRDSPKLTAMGSKVTTVSMVTTKGRLGCTDMKYNDTTFVDVSQTNPQKCGTEFELPCLHT